MKFVLESLTVYSCANLVSACITLIERASVNSNPMSSPTVKPFTGSEAFKTVYVPSCFGTLIVKHGPKVSSQLPAGCPKYLKRIFSPMSKTFPLLCS